MNVNWLPPPTRPEIGRGEAHVWFCDFSGITDFGSGPEVLGEVELQRASRFRSEDARVTFVGSHIVLRRVLGSYLQLGGDRVAFTVEAAGKPRLDRAVHATDIQFNLSHSHRSVICAVTCSVAVGIDLERPDPGLDELPMAEQVFSAQELRGLHELKKNERNVAFFLGWTKKEAYGKCKGLGLTADLPSVELGLDVGDSKFGGVSVVTFECPDSYIASLAVDGALGDTKFWKLESESLKIG